MQKLKDKMQEITKATKDKKTKEKLQIEKELK
jgi:hypothetical protein